MTQEEAFESDQRKAQLEQLRQSVNESQALQRKLNAEAGELRRETDWYPLAAGSALTLAIVAVVKLFL